VTVTGDRCDVRPVELLEAEITRDVIGAFCTTSLGSASWNSSIRSRWKGKCSGEGRTVGREVGVPVIYRGELLTRPLNYLRATETDVGLLLHFGPEATFYRVVQSKGKRHSRTEFGRSAGLARSAFRVFIPSPSSPENLWTRIAPSGESSRMTDA